MRELLFTFVTSIAALVYIVFALIQGSRWAWFAAGYALLLAIFAWANGRGKRWGRLGSSLLVCGLCVPLARELIRQWNHLGFVLIPANWMGWAYLLQFGAGVLALLFLVAVMGWLVLSTPRD